MIYESYSLEKIDINVSASLDVKIGSGSSLKYCFSMSAISYGDRPSKSVFSRKMRENCIRTNLLINPCYFHMINKFSRGKLF